MRQQVFLDNYLRAKITINIMIYIIKPATIIHFFNYEFIFRHYN